MSTQEKKISILFTGHAPYTLPSGITPDEVRRVLEPVEEGCQFRLLPG